MSDEAYRNAAIKAATELFSEVEDPWVRSDLVVAFATLVLATAFRLRDQREAEDKAFEGAK